MGVEDEEHEIVDVTEDYQLTKKLIHPSARELYAGMGQYSRLEQGVTVPVQIYVNVVKVVEGEFQ